MLNLHAVHLVRRCHHHHSLVTGPLAIVLTLTATIITGDSMSNDLVFGRYHTHA